ncbi:MAG: iron ABC transporter permease [candidate division NC10 bacterium]|nr:iron ABC transporter permease [candidate division NC10 bacterium]
MRQASLSTVLMGIPVGVILLGAVVYPSLILVWQGFSRAGQPTLANFTAVLGEADTWWVLWNSLYVSLWATALGGAAGTALAFLVCRTNLPGRRVFRTVLLLPYLIPPFIGALAWLALVGPVGFVNQFWMAVTGASDPLFRIYGAVGIILALALYNYPLAYLTVLASLERMDPALEEAARSSGATPLRMVRDVTLPIIAPAIGAGAVLVFLSSVANFGIPAILGFPAKYFVLTTKIYATILDFDRPHNLSLAAALSFLLVLAAAVAMGLQRISVRGRSYGLTRGIGKPTLLDLGRWRRPAGILVGVFLVVTSVAPVLAILLTSLTRAFGMPLGWDNLTLRNYISLFVMFPAVWRSLWNSLLLAASSASVAIVLAVLVAYVQTRTGLRGKGALEGLVVLPFAVPGTVVALAMILAFLKPTLGIALYNTIWIILVAYIARFLALAVKPIVAAFTQVHPSLEEAARSSGATLSRSLWDVTVPLIRPALVAGWFMAAVPAVTELTLSVLLWSVGNETVGVMVFNMHEEGKVLLSSALAVVVMLLALGSNLAIRRLTGGWGGA